MHLTRVSSMNLEVRLDAQFYRPDYLAAEQTIREAGRCGASIGTLGAALSFFETGVSTKTPGRLPLLKTRAIGDGCLQPLDFDETVDAPQELHLVSDDVLLCTYGTGSIGKVAYVGADGANRTVDYTIAILRPEGASTHAGYVAAFLGCKYGQAQIARHTKGTTGITFVLRSDLVRVVFPRFSEEAQRYIGDKVRQSERLRERARRLDTLTFAAFDPLTRGLPSPQRAFRVPSSEVEAYRLNPNHFDPVVRAAIHAAKAIARLHALADLVVDGDIAGGATPLGAQYGADGIFFARVQNVKPLRLDRSDAAFITVEQDREIVRSRCRTDDLVLSITGYPGTASVVLDEDLPLNINQHSVRFAVRSEFGAGYVAAALNSRFGQLQVGRLAVGGTRDALDYTSVRSLLIPEFSTEVREAVNAQVRTANLCQRAAQRLVTLSKLLIEHLIDGHLTEADLVAAQKALKAGDRSADREILKAFRQSATPNSKPLIADVDALYAILDASGGQDA